MLGADDDGQAGTVDVFVQQPDQPLLLLDHLQQRVQRPQRAAPVLAEQRRRAVDVEHAVRPGRSAKVDDASRIARAISASYSSRSSLHPLERPLRARGERQTRRTRR